MKKILVRLDTDEYPSLFDRIVAYDARADEVISYGRVTAMKVRSLIQDAFLPGAFLISRTRWFGSKVRTLSWAKSAWWKPNKPSLVLSRFRLCSTRMAAAAVLLQPL